MTWYRAARWIPDDRPVNLDQSTSWAIGYFCWLDGHIMEVESYKIIDAFDVELYLQEVETEDLSRAREIAIHWKTFNNEDEIPL